MKLTLLSWKQRRSIQEVISKVSEVRQLGKTPTKKTFSGLAAAAAAADFEGRQKPRGKNRGLKISLL